jgi:outer membrane autotransporter protein
MPLSLSPTTKGKEVAAVHNHLLSFTVLALLNAHSPSTLANSEITLTSEELTLDDLRENEFGIFNYRATSGDTSVVVKEPSELNFSREASLETDWLDMAFLSHAEGKITLTESATLSLKSQGAESVAGLRTEKFRGFGKESQALKIALEAEHALNQLDYAVAWNISESACELSESGGAPGEIHLTLHTKGLSDGATAAALLINDSDVAYQGRFVISASDSENQENIRAIELWGSRFHFESTGGSKIHGNILVDSASDLYLGLNRPGDVFEGRIVNEVEDSSTRLSLSSGAQWSTEGFNRLDIFDWGKGGVLDLTHGAGHAFIKSYSGDGEAISETRIEDGARLKISLTDKDLQDTGYKLELGTVTPISPEGSRVFIEIIDQRTDQSEENIHVGLIKVDNVNDSHTKFFAESVPSYYETALGAFKSYGTIGTDGKDGFVLTGIKTDLLGPSDLVKNMLDFTAGLSISHEQNADRVFSSVSDRLSQRKERGLWASVQTRETELNLERRTRGQTLKTQSLTVGYDADLNVPFFNKGAAGLWASVNQSDSDLARDSGDMDENAFGFYLHGLTDDNYRLILFTHYGQGDNRINTEGFFGEANEHKKVRYRLDSRSYGAGLYFGFAYPDLPRGWFLEPFVSGHTYWVDIDKSNKFEGVSFETEKIHRSLTKVGLTVGKQFGSDESVSFYSQAAWVHRFDQSRDLTGFDNQSSRVFETEDLQESWGYLKFAAHWQMNSDFALGADISVFTSEVVKPNYECGIYANYRF